MSILTTYGKLLIKFKPKPLEENSKENIAYLYIFET